MRVLAIITARSGSQGLPGKNIRPFCGRPLISHSIDAARQVGNLISRIVLSTDTEEIAAIGRECGADVPFLRPAELAGPDAASLPVILHALEFAEQEEGRRYDWVLLLQPTSPLRTGEDIKAAIEVAGTHEATAVISVTDATDSHPMKMRTIQNGLLRSFDGGEISQIRRQDFQPQAYKTNGAIYLTQRDVLVNERDFYGERPYPHVMPFERSIDIDTALDFEIAQFVKQLSDVSNSKSHA